MKCVGGRRASNRGKEDLELFVPLPASTDPDVVGQIGFIFLDHTLGEYIVMTRVGAIKFLTSDAAPSNARPISELPGHFGLPTLE